MGQQRSKPGCRGLAWDSKRNALLKPDEDNERWGGGKLRRFSSLGEGGVTPAGCSRGLERRIRFKIIEGS